MCAMSYLGDMAEHSTPSSFSPYNRIISCSRSLSFERWPLRPLHPNQYLVHHITLQIQIQTNIIINIIIFPLSPSISIARAIVHSIRFTLQQLQMAVLIGSLRLRLYTIWTNVQARMVVVAKLGTV